MLLITFKSIFPLISNIPEGTTRVVKIDRSQLSLDTTKDSLCQSSRNQKFLVFKWIRPVGKKSEIIWVRGRRKEQGEKAKRIKITREKERRRVKTVVDLNYTAIKVPPTKQKRRGTGCPVRIERKGFFVGFWFPLVRSGSIERFDQSCRAEPRSSTRKNDVAKRTRKGMEPKLIGVRRRGWLRFAIANETVRKLGGKVVSIEVLP